MTTNTKYPNNPVETIKQESAYLRGGIAQGLKDSLTGSLADDDTQLTKFHGIYQQYDRETVVQRRKQKLEPKYSFMIRARMPGGVCTPGQWIKIDEIADQYGGGSIRLTTRQTFQYHGIIKKNLKTTVQQIDQALLDTIAACGDVNRNVISSSQPELSSVHQEVYDVATDISRHLTPQTTAYHEIWLDGKKHVSSEEKEDIYGKTYLPRKFKIALAIPPDNDVDIYAQDLGFIAIVKENKLLGFNVTVGGGMGATHGDPRTFPQTASVIGFCQVDQVLQVAENIVKIQRDYGDRSDRKHARFKYTIDDRGLDWIVAELNQRLGWSLKPAQDFQFETTGDKFGWKLTDQGKHSLTLYIPYGRVIDQPGYRLKSALRKVAELNFGEIRITANQNLIFTQLTEDQKQEIEKILTQYKILNDNQLTLLHLNSLACVALPTCSLAMAEAERYLPDLLDKLHLLLKKHGIDKTTIKVRMTGCPNGCARPYLAEIGFVGKGPGKYNLYLGGSFNGDRLNQMYRENINEETILNELDKVFRDFAINRIEEEKFGDFVIRKNYVQSVSHGSHVHLPLKVQS